MKHKKKHAKKHAKKGGTKTKKLSDSGRKRLRAFSEKLKNKKEFSKPRALHFFMDKELDLMSDLNKMNVIKNMEKNVNRFTKKNIFGGKKYKHKKRGSKKTMKHRKKQK